MESISKNTERLSPEKVKAIKGAIFGAFLSALPTHQAESANFDFGTDWLSGIATMEQAMEKEKNEFAGLFVVAPGEVGEWSNPVNGDHDSVAVNFKKDLEVIDKYVNKEVSEDVFRVCVAHTHPADNHELYQYGPSPADFKADARFSKYVYDKVADEYGVQVQVNGMVFERHGVWYYSLIGPAATFDYAGVDDVNIGNHFETFKRTLEEPADAHKYTERLAVTRLVLAQKGIKARFVDYASFYIEPPCAGVSYDPDAVESTKIESLY